MTDGFTKKQFLYAVLSGIIDKVMNITCLSCLYSVSHIPQNRLTTDTEVVWCSLAIIQYLTGMIID